MNKDSRLLYEAYSSEILNEGVKEWLLGLGACILAGSTSCVYPDLGGLTPEQIEDIILPSEDRPVVPPNAWDDHRDRMAGRPVSGTTLVWFSRWFRSIEEMETGTLDNTRVKDSTGTRVLYRDDPHRSSDVILIPAEFSQTMTASYGDQMTILRQQDVDRERQNNDWEDRVKQIGYNWGGHLHAAFNKQMTPDQTYGSPKSRALLFSMFHTIKNTEYGKKMKDREIMEVLFNWGPDPDIGWPGWNKYTEDWFKIWVPWMDRQI